MKDLRFYILLFKHQLTWMIAGTTLALIAVLSSIGLMALSGWFISITGFIATAGNLTLAANFNYFYPSAGVRTFSMSRIMSRYGERLVTHEATFRILTKIRVWFYEKLEPLAPSHLLKYRSGDLLARLTNDINSLDNLYIRILSPTIVLILSAIVIFIFYSFFSIKIASFTAIMLLLSGFFIPYFNAKLAMQKSKGLSRKESKLKVSIVEHVQSLSELKIFGSEYKSIETIKAASNDFVDAQRHMSCYTGVGSALMTASLGFTVIGVTFMAVNLVHLNMLNGAFIALLILGAMAVFEAVMPLPSAYQYLGNILSSTERLNQIINQKPTIHFPQENVSLLSENYDIDFIDISFGYTQDRLVFNKLSLTIPYRKKIALVAPTGCGKTTLVALLTRLWEPRQGAIKIANTDIRKLSEENLRKVISILPQSPHIFNETIRYNLIMANHNATEEMLWDALEKVQLKEHVISLPMQLNSWVGEHGQHLSGGQRKRLALARIFLQSSPIVILDEPTENLDNITQDNIMHNILKHCKNKTLILITHNLSLAASMDGTITLK